MATFPGYVCATCGAFHAELPLCYGTPAPDLWEQLSEEERAERGELTPDLCVIDDASYFVRGHLEIPIQGTDELFIYAVWVSLSVTNFARTRALWNDAARAHEPPYFGWFSTSLPGYPETLNLKTMVHTRAVGLVPWIELEPTDHPLAVEQRTGITWERIREIAEMACDAGSLGSAMNSSDVLELVHALQQAGIDVWLDGGWGVDALLGRQTREHADLDVVVALADVEAITHALRLRGFVVAADELPTRLVLQDQRGRQIDFHTVTFDPEGGGVQQLQDGRSYRYPPPGFAGMGTVHGHPVRCLAAQVQAECHYGYEPDANDHHDIRLLHEHFGIPLKAPYLGPA